MFRIKSILRLSCAVSAVIVLAAGCSVKTYTFKQDRADQSLSGNQGVLVGDRPASVEPDQPKQREMFGMDIEFFGLGNKPDASASAEEAGSDSKAGISDNRGYMTSGSSSSSVKSAPKPYKEDEIISEYLEEESQPIEVDMAVEEQVESPVYEERTYKVKPGDTLDKIAARDDIYGDPTKWRVIYEANRDIIDNPNKIYVGQILVIPSADSTRSDSEPEQYIK